MPGKQAWDVFQEDDAGLHVHDDPKEIRPEPALVVGAELLSGVAPRLAREAGNEAIHLAAVRSAVEGRKIVPDRSAIQGLVFHPRHESGRSVAVPLDITHAAGALTEPVERRADTFAEHADTGAGFEVGNPGT